MVTQVFVVAAVAVAVAVVGVVRCTRQLRAISLWISFCLSKLKDFPLYVLLQPMFCLRPLQTTIKHSCASVLRTLQCDRRAWEKVGKLAEIVPQAAYGPRICLQM